MTKTTCGAAQGGGVYVDAGETAERIDDAILAYNGAYELYMRSGSTTSVAPELTWSDLYSPTGSSHNLPALDPSVRTVEPGLQAYGPDGLPIDPHLAGSSPLVDGGDPAASDVDGSRADMGCYGGGGGGGIDQDQDRYPAHFWPGSIQDAPSGIDGSVYDADDRAPTTH
jgi:hypothetical protein